MLLLGSVDCLEKLLSWALVVPNCERQNQWLATAWDAAAQATAFSLKRPNLRPGGITEPALVLLDLEGRLRIVVSVSIQ